MTNNTTQQTIINKIDDGKGINIVTLDVRGKSSITDTMIIATGTSTRHVLSLAEKVLDLARELDIPHFGSNKGLTESDWLVIDLGDIIVHLMHQESRELYALEKLWG